MENKIVLAIDAGGTFLKSALVDGRQGIIQETLLSCPANSDGDAEEVKSSYKYILQNQLKNAEIRGLSIKAVCIDTPGPFDFENGASLMTHKYRAIYGIPIASWIREEAKEIPIKFLHDSTAFILGEKTTLPEYKNIAGVMIGTGLGFALMKDDRVLLNEKHGPYVSIFNTPYNCGVAEDFVSGRGIVSKYNAVSGKAVKTAKDVACLAEQGDENAIFTYRQMGTVLAETIKPVLAKQKTEALIIGGQIARSLHLFEDVLESQLGDLSELKIIRASRLIDTGHLLGAAKLAYSN